MKLYLQCPNFWTSNQSPNLKHFKEPRNRFLAWRAGTTTLSDVPAPNRHMGRAESIPWNRFFGYFYVYKYGLSRMWPHLEENTQGRTGKWARHCGNSSRTLSHHLNPKCLHKWSRNQCCGSVTFRYGSGLTDPAPDPPISSVTFKMATRIFFL